MAQSSTEAADALALALAELEESPVVVEAKLMDTIRGGVWVLLSCANNHPQIKAENRQISRANPTLAACAVSLLEYVAIASTPRALLKQPPRSRPTQHPPRAKRAAAFLAR